MPWLVLAILVSASALGAWQMVPNSASSAGDGAWSALLERTTTGDAMVGGATLPLTAGDDSHARRGIARDSADAPLSRHELPQLDERTRVLQNALAEHEEIRAATSGVARGPDAPR